MQCSNVYVPFVQVPVGSPVLCGSGLLCDPLILTSRSQRGQYRDLHPRHFPKKLGKLVVCYLRPINFQVRSHLSLHFLPLVISSTWTLGWVAFSGGDRGLSPYQRP